MFFFPFYVTWFCFFSSTLWGQSSTWQFLSTFLTHFSLSQNKLIGVSRSHVKDLAQRWLNVFLSSSFPSVEIFSATWCNLHFCSSGVMHLSFLIKQVLPSRDLFSPAWNKLKWRICEEQIYDNLCPQKVVLYTSVRMALIYDTLEILCFFWCAWVSVSEEWYSMFPGPSGTLSRAFSSVFLLLDFCSFPKHSDGETTSRNIIWPFF